MNSLFFQAKNDYEPVDKEDVLPLSLFMTIAVLISISAILFIEILFHFVSQVCRRENFMKVKGKRTYFQRTRQIGKKGHIGVREYNFKRRNKQF